MIGPKLFSTGLLVAVTVMLPAMAVVDKHGEGHKIAWGVAGVTFLLGVGAALVGAVMWIWEV